MPWICKNRTRFKAKKTSQKKDGIRLLKYSKKIQNKYLKNLHKRSENMQAKRKALRFSTNPSKTSKSSEVPTENVW